MVWCNPPARLEVADPYPYGHLYDPTISDPAFLTGVYFGGDARFRFRSGGRYLTEFILGATDVGEHSFVLEANGAAVDNTDQSTPGVRWKKWRNVTLLAVVDDGSVITIRTRSARYLLKAVRWTPVEEFEHNLVPVWLQRARHLFANPIFGVPEGRRRDFLEQLLRPLTLSRQPDVKREAVLGLARAVYWLVAEGGEPREIERLTQLFQEARALTPDSRVLRQMISAACVGMHTPPLSLGAVCRDLTAVPWDVAVPQPPAGAPPWAVEQRRLAARMDSLTRWWVEERQHSNGELGGGWEDDVEILRAWGPQALGFGSEVAERGLRRIAEGIWSSGLLLDGYLKRITDAEHSAEPTADTQPLLAALSPDDPSVLQRLAKTSACAQNWIVKQPDGHWRFRGAWFNCSQFDPRPERAIDVHYHVRAMGPALWYAFLTREQHLVDLLKEWAASWVQAMRSTSHGKPAGIFPSTVRSADGSYLVNSVRWDKPNAEYDYFHWSGSSQEALTSLVLAVYDLTGEASWLKAASESFQVLNHCGTYAALCEQIAKAPQAFYAWRKYSEDSQYDKFFDYTPRRPPSEILSRMATQAHREETRLSVNFDMLTREVLFTDRCGYGPPPEYRQYLFGGEAPRGERYPNFAVTWPAVKHSFARAALLANPTKLELRFYSFESGAIQVPLRVWQLQFGRYLWRATDSLGAPMAKGEVAVSKRAQLIELPLLPHKEVLFTLEKVN